MSFGCVKQNTCKICDGPGTEKVGITSIKVGTL